MATRDKDVAKLKEYIRKLKLYLRKHEVFDRKVANNLKRLNRQGGNPPGVTDPPKPPFRP